MEDGQDDGSRRLDVVAAALLEPLRTLLFEAGEEARSLQHRYVGTGHLAVAAISAGDATEGVPSVEVARERLEALLGRGTADNSSPPELTPRAMQLLAECRSGNDPVANVLPALRRLDASVSNHVLDR